MIMVRKTQSDSAKMEVVLSQKSIAKTSTGILQTPCGIAKMKKDDTEHIDMYQQFIFVD
jgi:hypothetical protein